MISRSVFGIIIIVNYRKKSFLRYDLVVKKKKMNLNVLFKIMLCFLFAQAIFFVSSIGVEKLLNYFGYTIMRDIETASSVSTTLSMFLYASIIGPIAEEFLFRGALLRELEKHGKLFAIIVSSVLFGVFHSNILQGLFATIVGLILGYVTIEYSIKWAIILHIINNFIFGDVLGFILSYFSPNSQEIFNIIILVPSLLGGLLVLFKSRNGIKNYIKINKSKEKLYRFTFSSAWIIFYIIVNLLIAISGIVKII